MSVIPDLREELDRKTMETVEWLFRQFNSGQISSFQFSTGVDTMFMAVSGLVDDGIINLVTAADELLGAFPKKDCIKRHFVKNGRIVTLVSKFSSASYSLRVIGEAVESNKEMSFSTSSGALKAMNVTADRFLSVGYREL